MLKNMFKFEEILKSPGGGIGRRAGFKIQFFRECGFDSRPGYFKNDVVQHRFFYD